jgi:hypothetical protein
VGPAQRRRHAYPAQRATKVATLRRRAHLAATFVPVGGRCPERRGINVTDFDRLTWDEAMRRGHAALIASEGPYDEINASEGLEP